METGELRLVQIIVMAHPLKSCRSCMGMLDRVRGVWQRLSDSLWFVPAILVGAALLLAFLLIDLSSRVSDDLLAHFPRLFGAGPDGSRSMLSTIAGSMVTVAGVTFSILVVAVSQAATQYTPRVMRNFMRDRSSQATLGVLAGVFVYCLIVLRTIRAGDPEFVPELAVAAAVMFALAAVTLLMYFIHHIASTLDVSEILGAITAETHEAIDRLFPDRVGAGGAGEGRTEDDFSQRAWSPILAASSGYIQHVLADQLLHIAEQHDAVIRMERGVGEFAAQDTPLAAVSGAHAHDELIEQVREAYVLSAYRTVLQDAAFGIRQIVDIALKALSPSVNDPTTAVTCIDHLTAVLVRLVGRRIPDPQRRLNGRVRVIARGPDFESLVHLSFEEIRRTAATNVRVLTSALSALEAAASAAQSNERRAALDRQIERFERTVDGVPADEPGRTALQRACQRARQAAAPIV